MEEKAGGIELTGIELSGAALKIKYAGPKGEEAVFEPDVVRLSLDALFVPWPDQPANLKQVRVEWRDNPFWPDAYQRQGKIRRILVDGIEVQLEDFPPQQLRDMFSGMTASLNQRLPDAAVRTSKLYTNATVVSACGLLCGAVAILLPLLIVDKGWVDLVSKILLVLMVASIGAFAWIRSMAGKEEVRAIGQRG